MRKEAIPHLAKDSESETYNLPRPAFWPAKPWHINTAGNLPGPKGLWNIPKIFCPSFSRTMLSRSSILFMLAFLIVSHFQSRKNYLQV